MKVTKKYKDTMFRLLFKDKEELLSLYNAVNDTHYTDAGELETNTLENAIYMNMKNDISFLIDSELNLYGQQSTVNPNMPLRDLFYVSDVLQSWAADYNLYGPKRVQIPTPRFVVFYNGSKKQPERQIYRLSEAFAKQMDVPELELIVTVININSGNNSELLGRCRSLKEYVQYTEKVRKYASTMPIEEAVEQTVTECINEGILTDFLKRNRSEAVKVSIYEFDEEKYKEAMLETGREEGRMEGRAEGRAEGREEGIAGSIHEFEQCIKLGLSLEEAVEKMQEKYGLCIKA